MYEAELDFLSFLLTGKFLDLRERLATKKCALLVRSGCK